MKLCKICNAELNEGALFCGNCGTKVEIDTDENTIKICKCGAELDPDSNFCNKCGASLSDIPFNTADEKNNNPAMAVITRIKHNPKYFGALGIVVLILVVASVIGINSKSRGDVAETSESKTYSYSSKNSYSGSGNSSSKVLTEDLKKLLVQSALRNEINKNFPLADANSTRYSINKSEKSGNSTIVYGKLYLYDKYGKLTKGRSGGSYSRTFEVKINNNTYKVTSCKIK